MWKNANKTKPQSGKLVLIYTPQETIHLSNVLLGIYWSDTNDWTVFDFGRSKELIVTHWKELPRPPL